MQILKEKCKYKKMCKFNRTNANLTGECKFKRKNANIKVITQILKEKRKYKKMCKFKRKRQI
jgi:hypothetical protein